MTVTSFIISLASNAMSALNLVPGLAAAEPFRDPTVEDVFRVKAILQAATPLPLEIVDTIIDHAEYWPRTTSFTQLSVSARGSTYKEDVFVTRTLPLGYLPDEASGKFNITLETYNPRSNDQLGDISPARPPNPAHLSNAEKTTPLLLEKWVARSLPRDAHPCRKLVFHIKSHDQGWGGGREDRGTYNGSFTWFDVGKEKIRAVDVDVQPELQWETEGLRRPRAPAWLMSDADQSSEWDGWGSLRYDLETVDPMFKPRREDEKLETWLTDATLEHPPQPHGMVLQKNLTAVREMQDREIVWRWDDDEQPEMLEAMGRGSETGNGDFVRSLQIGDVVTVWARARFPGWANLVEELRVDMYWAV